MKEETKESITSLGNVLGINPDNLVHCVERALKSIDDDPYKTFTIYDWELPERKWVNKDGEIS